MLISCAIPWWRICWGCCNQRGVNPRFIPDFEIRELGGEVATIQGLSELLVATVAANGSVSFLHPLAPEVATAFWSEALADAGRGGRIVFGAFSGLQLIATVTLFLDTPENQPHRGEIWKMMTAPDWRGWGAASALLRHAEAVALGRGRTLLVLDTAARTGAGGLYDSMGWLRVGEIPNYAVTPYGEREGTVFYYKPLIGGV